MFYVDELATANRPGFAFRPHSWNWCHLATDGTLEELHAFAAELGVDFAFYRGPGQLNPNADQGEVPYYDLTPGQRLAAVTRGALPVLSVELVERGRRS